MIKDKTILLICKETFSFPLYYLGKELEKNNNVHYFFINNSDVIFKTYFNRYTYFYFKEKINNERIHDVGDLNYEFFKNRKNIRVDYNRVKEIENKYTQFSNLNKQILSGQYTSTPYHDRFYYKDTTYEENLYWLVLNYDKTENLFELIKPDYIFDLDTSEIQRTIINEIANHKNILYVNTEFSRYESLVIPTSNIGLKLDKCFIDAFNENKNDKKFDRYIKLVKDYREQSSIMPDMYKDEITSSYDFSLKKAIKYFLSATYETIKYQAYYIRNNKNYIALDSPLYSNPFKRCFFDYLYASRNFYLHSNFNKYFCNPINEKYVYLPLHLIPESSTFVKAPMYVNELNLIEAISKSLPMTWKLYVKEHQAMIGERDLDFYKKASRFHNVRLVKSNYYKDPKPWIEKSLAVVTITGSAAFEAAMLNKPAIVFGNSCFNVLQGVKIAKGFEDLEPFFNSIEYNKLPNDNTLDCATYLKTVNDMGVDLNVKSLIKLSQKKMIYSSLEENEEKEFNQLFKNLLLFYEKAIKYLNN